MNKAVYSEKAPAAIGPYSQAVKAGNTLYVAGQIHIDGSTGELIEGSIEEKTEQVLKNIGYILHKAGYDFKHVVKTTVLLENMDDFAAMNSVYAKYFTQPYPARAAFQVAALPKGASIEIDAIAVKEE